MPELPEVELFRQLLLPLVSSKETLSFSPHGENPPRKWVTKEQIGSITNKYYCNDVVRKGKALYLVLQSVRKPSDRKYVLLHMGMTGLITSSSRRYVRLGSGGESTTARTSESDLEFPPRSAYLLLRSGEYTAAFSDTRKFGTCLICEDMSGFEDLAQDAYLIEDGSVVQSEIMPRIVGQATGIKAILLDQKRAVSGVGNWVADEVLYQCKLHPEQTHLTILEATNLFSQLKTILKTAITCLVEDRDYPREWLFHYRWDRKVRKDHSGRSFTFVKAGGRTSAVVVSVQKLYQRKSKGGTKATSTSKTIRSDLQSDSERNDFDDSMDTRKRNAPTSEESDSARKTERKKRKKQTR